MVFDWTETLSVSNLSATASVDDFELAEASVEIPAGQGVSGESLLQLAALGDNQFDGGPETVAVRFVPGGGVNASLGADVRVLHPGRRRLPVSRVERRRDAVPYGAGRRRSVRAPATGPFPRGPGTCRPRGKQAPAEPGGDRRAGKRRPPR